jgi:ribosome maturation factor RimP
MTGLLNEQITALIEPSIEDMGYELVEINLLGSRQSILQLVIERKDNEGITIDDCTIVSKSTAARLDVEDLMKQAYSLEITSPGIDRKLTKLEHYERFKGFEAYIESIIPLMGRTRLRCQLCGITGENIIKIKMLENGKLDEEETGILLSNIKKAKLVLTDELIKNSQER